MDADDPGLFDLPDDPPAPAKRSRRGRNRETWVRTAAAAVTIIDEGALSEAAALIEEGAVIVSLGAEPEVEAAEAEPGSGQATQDEFDTLVGLVWPTDGHEGPLEAGAFRVLSVDREIVAETSHRATLTWAITVKLTDVEALRRLALEAQPREASSIEESLAAAWQHAADPFAPLRSIPGITWRPGQVDVQHLARRGRPEGRGASDR